MRKFLFLVLGVIVAFASCRKDDLLGGENGKEVTVSLKAQLPGTTDELSRATTTGDGTKVTRYIMEVYTGGELYSRMVQADPNFELRLVTSQTYDFLFWADCGKGNGNMDDNHYNTISLTAVEMTGDYNGNDDTRDAFCGKLLSQTVTAAYTPETVTLKRPFGQLNVKTTDLGDINLDKLKPSNVFISFGTQLCTKLNVLDGSVSGEKTIQYSENANVIDANGNLSVDYVFAPETEKFLIDFTMKFFKGSNEITTNDNFKSIPIQRNYQTNVTGKLLTKQGNISVEVKPAFDGTNDHEIKEVASVTALNSALSSKSTSGNKPVAVSVTGQVTSEDATVEVPSALTVDNTPVISMSFPAGVADDATLTIKEGSEANYAGEVHVSIPTTDAKNIVINMPNATVYLNGKKVESVTAETGENTFVVGVGTEITTLTVKKGNVNVYGKVGEIKKDGENNENTIVNIFPGGSVDKVEEGITVKTIVPGIKNITTGKSYASVQEAVADAKAHETIELSEGRYPIYYNTPESNKDDADTYYLLIGKGLYGAPTSSDRNDQTGLTIVGVGNVTLYAGNDNNTGMVNGQDFIVINADNVTLKNLKIETNYNEYFQGPNKTIEVYEATTGFTMDGCEIIPNVKANNDGGSVYVGSYQTPDIGSVTATIKNCKFNYAGISVRYNATVNIENNTFNYIRPVEGWMTCISVRGNATLKGNTFKNVKLATEEQSAINILDNGVITMSNNIFPTTGKYWAGFVNKTKGTLYPTLEKTIAAAVKGDVIFFDAGTYEQDLTVPAGVTFLGEDTTSTILTGHITLNEGSTLKNFTHEWACPASPRTAMDVVGSNVTLDGVQLKGSMKKADNTNAEALVTYMSIANFTVKNCAFVGYWKGMYLNTCEGFVIENNEFTYNAFSTDNFDSSLVVKGNKFPSAGWDYKQCQIIVPESYASTTDKVGWSSVLKTFINDFLDNNTWSGSKSIRVTYTVEGQQKNAYVKDKIN